MSLRQLARERYCYHPLPKLPEPLQQRRARFSRLQHARRVLHWRVLCPLQQALRGSRILW